MANTSSWTSSTYDNSSSSSTTTTSITTAKRQKHYHHHHHQDDPLLIPGLPDHIAQLCLSSINPSLLFKVCHSWRRLIYSPSFPPFFSLYAILSPPKSHHNSTSIQLHNFDPISNTWQILPPPPQKPLLHHILLRHPSFLSRNLSIQSISVSDNLILLAATTHNLTPALSHPLIFNPIKGWSIGPALNTPRRWCALGTSDNMVYVASGIGSHFSIETAKSMEKWDLIKDTNWEKKAEMKDGRFSREAVDAVGWRGKLCMVNIKGGAAKEGVVYDVEEDTWKEMPEGMLLGFRGPVAAMEEEVMYVVDEAKGVMSKYNHEDDVWEEILVSQRLKGAEQMVAKRGRICVVSAAGISVVDVVAEPPRISVVELPEGFEAVAVHVLPRMPVTDFSVQK
ncbi:F-box/kelch-repeat protein [Trifolium repens]|nr:F-box/kelch-repeat protein [Trifolium repens]